jgi:arginyl-tRNA synthetase
VEKSEFEKLLIDFKEFKTSIYGQTAKKLNLELFERIIKRLDSFSPECEECSKTLKELEGYISKLKVKQDRFDKNDFKENNTKINNIISHLEKQHKLVREGTYLGAYMCFGISIGLVFGLNVFHNLALGMPIGMCLGMALGTSLDADAKKKGKTI